MSKKRVMITIEQADHERLRLQAYEQRTTVAALCRRYIAEALNPNT